MPRAGGLAAKDSGGPGGRRARQLQWQAAQEEQREGQEQQEDEQRRPSAEGAEQVWALCAESDAGASTYSLVAARYASFLGAVKDGSMAARLRESEERAAALARNVELLSSAAEDERRSRAQIDKRLAELKAQVGQPPPPEQQLRFRPGDALSRLAASEAALAEARGSARAEAERAADAAREEQRAAARVRIVESELQRAQSELALERGATRQLRQAVLEHRAEAGSQAAALASALEREAALKADLAAARDAAAARESELAAALAAARGDASAAREEGARAVALFSEAMEAARVEAAQAQDDASRARGEAAQARCNALARQEHDSRAREEAARALAGAHAEGAQGALALAAAQAALERAELAAAARVDNSDALRRELALARDGGARAAAALAEQLAEACAKVVAARQQSLDASTALRESQRQAAELQELAESARRSGDLRASELMSHVARMRGELAERDHVLAEARAAPCEHEAAAQARAAALDAELKQLKQELAAAQAPRAALESQLRVAHDYCSAQAAALDRVSSLALQLQAEEEREDDVRASELAEPSSDATPQAIRRLVRLGILSLLLASTTSGEAQCGHAAVLA